MNEQVIFLATLDEERKAIIYADDIHQALALVKGCGCTSIETLGWESKVQVIRA